MRLIGDGGEVRVHERNKVLDKRLLEHAEIEVASRGTPSDAVGCTSRSRRRVRLSRAAKWISPGLHRNYEGLGFAISAQVIPDQTGVPSSAPARFIFARAVLQIEHRVMPGRVLVVIGRRVNES